MTADAVNTYAHTVVRLRRSSGVEGFTPHDLRRTAATLMGERALMGERGVRPDVIERGELWCGS